MTEEEAYKVAQDACGFIVAEKVKVMHRIANRIEGWNNSWTDEMDDYVGGTYPIHKIIGSSGVTLLHPMHKDAYSFPYSVLLKAEEAKEVERKEKIERASKLRIGIKVSCGNVVEEVLFSEKLLAEMSSGNKLILNTMKIC